MAGSAAAVMAEIGKWDASTIERASHTVSNGKILNLLRQNQMLQAVVREKLSDLLGYDVDESLFKAYAHSTLIATMKRVKKGVRNVRLWEDFKIFLQVCIFFFFN